MLSLVAFPFAFTLAFGPFVALPAWLAVVVVVGVVVVILLCISMCVVVMVVLVVPALLCCVVGFAACRAQVFVFAIFVGAQTDVERQKYAICIIMSNGIVVRIQDL